MNKTVKRFLATGIAGFDAAHRGLERGRLHLISGEEKSGKTSLALQIACIASLEGTETFWLDCAGRLHHLRLKQITSSWGADSSMIRMAFPSTVKEQERMVLWLADTSPEDSLVVVDDFTYLYRVQMRGDPSFDQPLFASLTFQAALLKEAANTRSTTSIIISEIHEVPEGGGPRPVAAPLITHFADTQIRLSSLTPSWKVMRLDKGFGKGGEYRFRVHDGGVTEA